MEKAEFIQVIKNIDLLLTDNDTISDLSYLVKMLLIHIRNNGDVGTIKNSLNSPVKYFLLTVPRRCFIC